jgi:hypothetical protein
MRIIISFFEAGFKLLKIDDSIAIFVAFFQNLVYVFAFEFADATF